VKLGDSFSGALRTFAYFMASGTMNSLRGVDYLTVYGSEPSAIEHSWRRIVAAGLAAFVRTQSGSAAWMPQVGSRAGVRHGWRLYGDGGVRPTTIGASDELHTQTLTQGHQVAGRIAFEVPDDAYQLLTVGKMPGATVVVSTFLPMLPTASRPAPSAEPTHQGRGDLRPTRRVEDRVDLEDLAARSDEAMSE